MSRKLLMAPSFTLRRRIADEASGRGAVMRGIDLEADEAAVLLLGGDERRTGTGEGVEHHAILRTEHVDQRRECRDRLLRRVQLVAGVAKLDHVRDWLCWRSARRLWRANRPLHARHGESARMRRSVCETRYDQPGETRHRATRP